MSREEKQEANILDDFAKDFIPSEEERKEMLEEGQKNLKEAEFPWELALDTYDPTFPNYKPSADALNFFNVMRLVKGGDFPVQNSIAQYFMVDVLFDNVTVDMYPYSDEIKKHINIDNDRVAICCSRGLAKSTIVTNFLPIYVGITGKLPKYGHQSFWLLLGASSRGHARNMAVSIRAICEDSKFMNETMEYMRFTETEIELCRKGPGSEESRYFCMRFMGIFTPTRGQKNKFNARPDVALMDDCMPSQAASYSKVITENLKTAIYSDLGNALKARGGKIWNIFTPMNYQEPNTASILNGSFTPVILPVAKWFPDPENVKESDIVSSWPQEHTSKSIHKMWKLAKASKSLQLFMQERMLRLTSGADRLIPESCIQFCDMKPVIKNIDAYNVYITTDYTTTSGEGSDFSGVAVWAVSNNEDWFLLDLHLRKMSMAEQYEVTLSEAAKWRRKGKHVEIGVEVDGNQSAHIYSLEAEMAKRGDWYTFARQKGNTSSDRKGLLSRATGVKKHERFRLASQTLLQQKMWFPEHLKDTPDMNEFLTQIRGATHENFTRADDGPDLITMGIVTMHVVYPTDAPSTRGRSTFESDDGYIWEYDGMLEPDEDFGGSTVF